MRTIKKLELRERRVSLGLAVRDATMSGYRLTTPALVRNAAIDLIGEEAQEVFLVFLLDVRNRIIGYVEAARGGVDVCPVDPRVVFRAAVIVGASGIVVVHNHPSGDTTPSAEDLALTERLCRCGELLEIKLLDHVIVADGRHHSLLEQGVMPERRIKK